MYVVIFKQKTAYEMRISDWSSDVCSSDLSCLPRRRRSRGDPRPRPGRRRAPSRRCAAGRSPPRADALARHADDRLGARRAQLKRALDSYRVQTRAVVTDDEQTAVTGGEAGFDGGQGGVGEMVEMGRASCRGRVCEYV